MNLPLRALGVLAGACVILPGLPGQVPAPAAVPADEAVKLPEFTVASQRDTPYRSTDSISGARIRGELIDTPSSISVITREFMDELTPVRLYDATRYVSAVTEGRGPTFQDRIIIRGFENDNRTVDNFSMIANANFDEALVERIEVVKGPNSIFAPTGTPGGSVNVITKSPITTARNVFTATIGRYDAQKASLDSTGPIRNGKFAYRVIGSYQDTDRQWAGSFLRQAVISPQLTYFLSPRTQLTAKYIYQNYTSWGDPRVLIDSSIARGEPGRKAAYYSRTERNGAEAWNERNTRLHKATAFINTSLGDNVSMRLAANYQYTREADQLSSLIYPGTGNRYDPYTGYHTPNYTWAAPAGTTNFVATFSELYNPRSIPRNSTLGRSWGQRVDVQNDFAANYKFGSVSSTTVAGWVLAHVWTDAFSKVGTLPNSDLLNPVYGAVATYPTLYTTWTANTSDTKQAYAMEKLGFLKDRLFATAGMSRLWVDNSSQNLRTGAPVEYLKDNRDTFFAGALAKIPGLGSVYYSYSENANPVVLNNRPLWREGTQHEAGIKREFLDRRFSATLAWFDIVQNNVVIPNPEFQLNPNVPQFLIFDLTNDGWELELAGTLSKNWSVLGSATYQNSRDSYRRRPRAIADRAASLLVSYRFTETALKNLNISLGASYTGDAAGDAPPAKTVLGVVAQPSFFVPSYTTFTLNVSYRWSRYGVRMTVDNLFDKEYLYSSGARFAVAESPSRNFRFTFTSTF